MKKLEEIIIFKAMWIRLFIIIINLRIGNGKKMSLKLKNTRMRTLIVIISKILVHLHILMSVLCYLVI